MQNKYVKLREDKQTSWQQICDNQTFMLSFRGDCVNIVILWLWMIIDWKSNVMINYTEKWKLLQSSLINYQFQLIIDDKNDQSFSFFFFYTVPHVTM